MYLVSGCRSRARRRQGCGRRPRLCWAVGQAFSVWRAASSLSTSALRGLHTLAQQPPHLDLLGGSYKHHKAWQIVCETRVAGQVPYCALHPLLVGPGWNGSTWSCPEKAGIAQWVPRHTSQDTVNQKVYTDPCISSWDRSECRNPCNNSWAVMFSHAVV